MSQQWHYARNGIRKAPVSPQGLSELARSGGLAPDDLVWREGLADWVRADKVSGLVFREPPAAKKRSANASDREAAWQRLRAVAVPHREINLTLAWSFVGFPILFATLPEPMIWLAAILADNALFGWQISRLSAAMNRNVRKDVILVFVPVVGLFTILNLVQAAGRLFKSANVKVGFLGVVLPPDPPSAFRPSAELLALDTPRAAEPPAL